MTCRKGHAYINDNHGQTGNQSQFRGGDGADESMHKTRTRTCRVLRLTDNNKGRITRVPIKVLSFCCALIFISSLSQLAAKSGRKRAVGVKDKGVTTRAKPTQPMDDDDLAGYEGQGNPRPGNSCLVFVSPSSPCSLMHMTTDG